MQLSGVQRVVCTVKWLTELKTGRYCFYNWLWLKYKRPKPYTVVGLFIDKRTFSPLVSYFLATDLRAQQMQQEFNAHDLHLHRSCNCCDETISDTSLWIVRRSFCFFIKLYMQLTSSLRPPNPSPIHDRQFLWKANLRNGLALKPVLQISLSRQWFKTSCRTIPETRPSLPHRDASTFPLRVAAAAAAAGVICMQEAAPIAIKPSSRRNERALC